MDLISVAHLALHLCMLLLQLLQPLDLPGCLGLLPLLSLLVLLDLLTGPTAFGCHFHEVTGNALGYYNTVD